MHVQLLLHWLVFQTCCTIRVTGQLPQNEYIHVLWAMLNSLRHHLIVTAPE